MKEFLVYGFLIFIFGSFIGYIIEIVWLRFRIKKFVNRGFFCGPILPIYGLGLLLLIECLYRYHEFPLVVLIFGMIITSSLEYFLSFLMEKLFHNRWWDYSYLKYNLNGRICLRNTILFGILSLVSVYLIVPFLDSAFKLLPLSSWMILAIVLGVLFVIDAIYSISIAYNLRNRIIIVEDLKNQKLSMIPKVFKTRLLKATAQFKKYPTRLLNAYPELEHKYHKPFEIMKESQNNIKKKRTKK